MTCIGAIRTIEQNGDITITMGADTCASHYRRIAEQETDKIVKKSGMLMAASGSVRYINLLKHIFVPPERKVGQEPTNYVATCFIPELISMLKTNEQTEMREGGLCTNSNMLLACEGKLFEIGVDFSYMESKEYSAIGSGTKYMISALHATQDIKDAEKRLERGLEAAALFDFYVSKPFHFEKVTFKGEVVITDQKKLKIKKSKLKNKK